jgi:hypothetical protein
MDCCLPEAGRSVNTSGLEGGEPSEVRKEETVFVGNRFLAA